MTLARLAVRVVVLAAIIALTERLVTGLHVHGDFWWYIWIALIYSVVNLFVGSIFRLLAIPFIILTLGLFLLIVNAALLEITAAISSRLTIDNFGSAILGGFVIAVFSWLADMLLPDSMRRRPRRRQFGDR